MTSVERRYTTKRRAITNALVDELKKINGSGEFLTSVYDNVFPTLRYWDEINDFPAIHLNPGPETRQYHPSQYKDRFLTMTLRCYVNDQEDCQLALDGLLEDIETVLEQSAYLKYNDARGKCHKTHQLSIISIDTDEGILDPIAAAEIIIEIQY